MSVKQEIAQHVLSQGKRIKIRSVSLLYAPASIDSGLAKGAIIVSVPKKSVDDATKRNYVKRRLRHLLRMLLPKQILFHHDWMWIYKDSHEQIKQVVVDFTKVLSEQFPQTETH